MTVQPISTRLKSRGVISCFLIFFFTACTSASAQIGAELTGAHADKRWGAEVGAGYAFHYTKHLSLVPAGGLFLVSANNTQYYQDNNGGNPRCRDSSTGRYATNSSCNNLAVRGYGKAEGLVSFSKISIGAGGRFSSEVQPYGVLSYSLLPKIRLRLNAGPEYYAFGATFGF